MRLWLVTVLLVGSAACTSAVKPAPRYPDAPMQLRDDTDRDQAIDELWVLPPGAERDRERAGITAALGRRITDALEEDKPLIAEQLLFQLASLWQQDPQNIASGLVDQAPLLNRLRATFAKAGALEPAVAALVLLAEVEPGKRTEHLAELDEVLSFSDDLAAAENGPQAERAQPIALLQPTVLALPLPWLVDRYVHLLEERQRVITQQITAHGASIQLVRAHHDILSTSRRIAIALARAGHTDDIFRHIGPIKGLGDDQELRTRAEIVAEQPTADAYHELARVLRNDDKLPDPAAALAVCLKGLEKFPNDVPLLTAAAQDAASLGRVDQPIELYEAAIAASKDDVDAATALRLGKLYGERIARLAFGGRPAAATTAWRELARYTRHAESAGARAVWDQVAATGETALGRGLLSQGRLHDAERELVASLDRAPSVDAYETLAQIHYKTGRFASAHDYASRGIAILGETTGDHYRRAKLERIAGDVARAQGRAKEAGSHYLDSLRTWASLGEAKNLTRSIAAERMLESGRALWYLGLGDKSVEMVLEGLDYDPDSGALAADATAFLLEVGRYTDAAEALHRSLDGQNISEFYKVYMCLWILADGRRRGEPRDQLAYDYLTGRHGDLWYEQLAEAATGRLDFAQLRAAATTAPHQAELAFYGTVLGLDPDAATPAGARKLLEQVVAAHLVMDAEYDLARQYLTPP